MALSSCWFPHYELIKSLTHPICIIMLNILELHFDVHKNLESACFT